MKKIFIFFFLFAIINYMNAYVFKIGNFGVRWYSLLILIGVIVGILLIEKEGKKFNISKDFLFNMAFWAIIIGIIGARLYYVIFNFNLYQNDLLSIFKIWEGGLAIHGGVIAGLLFIISYCKRYSISYKYMIDFCAPGLLIGQAIGRWGNFFNSEAHGGPTTYEFLKSIFVPEFVIDGMKINEFYYQPTFYYESLWCLVGFIIVILIRKLKYIKLNQITSFYLIWYGLGRLFIEAMRTDNLMIGSFRIAQIVSLLMIFIGIIIYFKSSKGSRFVNQYHDIENFNEYK